MASGVLDIKKSEVALPDLEFPERLTVELTNHCNLSCVMCPRQKMDRDLGYMDLSLYKRIMDEAGEHLPVALVPFFRGESLLHPHFIEMMEISRRAGIGPVQLTTNAMLLDRGLSEALIGAGIDFISFSLDVLGKGSYEDIRIGGDYERVTGNIEGFLEIRKRMRVKKPEVQVSAVETERNSAGLSEFIEYWRKRVDRVRIYPEHSSKGGFGSLADYTLPEFAGRLPCRKVFTDMVVYWDGTVAVCNHDWDRREHIGSVRHDSIEDIWKSPKYGEIRRRHIDGGLEADPTCRDCDHWKMYYIRDGIVGKLYEADGSCVLLLKDLEKTDE